jgi:transcriptional regulator with XRE-family HTH domain
VSELTDREQRSVRTTLLFLRVRAGGAWEPVARALHVEEDTIAKVAHGRRPVTARLAIRVARLIEVGVDELLAGRHLSSRVCPHCGHLPEDFVDEETFVTDRQLASAHRVDDQERNRP